MAVRRLKATPGRGTGRLGRVPEWPAFLSRPQAIWIAVAALTAIAFLLRLPHIDETLILDEHYAYAETHVGGLSEVIERVRNGGENSPPLYFVLAWAAMKLGDPTVLIRLPSLLLSTATVPVVYLLGIRTVGRRAGLIAAALMTFSPFAIFYSSEARPYATLMFLVACSTIALLLALERGGRLRWAVYALTACAVLYTHYFGAFALIAQGAWALWAHRERTRELVLTHVAIALGYVPWLLAWLDQKGNSISQLASYWPLNAKGVSRELTRLFVGHPNVKPSELPGRAAVALFGLAIAAALVGTAVRHFSRPRQGSRVTKPSAQLVLLVLLAVGPVVGFLAYSAIGPNITIARYMSPALPAVTLLVGAALASSPRWVSLPATAVVIACLAIGAVSSLQAENRRPAWREAAHFIDRNAHEGDPVVEADCGLTVTKACRRWAKNPNLDISFEKRHNTTLAGRRVFSDPPPRGRVFVAGVATGILQAPRPAADDGLCLIRRRVFAGQTPVVVNEYVEASPPTAALARRDGKELIALPSGTIPVSRGAATGKVDRVEEKGNRISVDGWSLGPSREPAGCLLVFMRGRLLGSASATESRPDIGNLYGSSAAQSGFRLSVAHGYAGQFAQSSKVRVFAVVDGRAAELESA